MKLELERQDFLKAWQNAEKLASAKSAKESTGGVLITASEDNSVVLEATDLKTSIRCIAKGANVIVPGKAVLPSGIFGGMLRKLPEDEILLEANSTRGLLKSGGSMLRFAAITIEEFPNIPKSSDADLICEIPAPVLARLIIEGSSASSQPQDFPKYLGTCLFRISGESFTAVSTDGKRLSLSKAFCSASKDEDLLLPAQALKDLAKTIAPLEEDKDVRVSADGSTAWFELEDAEYSIRRVDSQFPKFERILNDELCTTLRIDSGDLGLTLERIDVIAKTTPAHIMNMILSKKGELSITARAPELGTAKEKLRADVEGEDLQLGFNVGYFMDGLKALGGEKAVIEFSSEEGQTRMKREGSDDFLYMLMPARLSQQDLMTEEESVDFDSSTQEQEDVQEQEAPAEQQDITENPSESNPPF